VPGTDGHDLAELHGRIGAHELHARPLSSFTPEQQRLIRALIEAGRTAPPSGPAQRAPQPNIGAAR
jgi:hypothetical protein